MSTTRGRVLRDTTHGDGLISVAGKQYPFKLEGAWRSDRAPKVDMQVDVELADDGAIVAIRAVDSAAAAREQAERLVSAAGETAKQWAADLQAKGGPALAEIRAKSAPFLAELRAKGLPVVKRYLALVGAPTLIALAAVLLGWFFLAAVSIDIFGERQSATFYDYLRILNNPQNGLVALEGGRTGTGLYGFLAIVALLAPLLPHAVKSRRLWLAYCAPAAFMVVAGVTGWWKMRSATSQLGGPVAPLGAEFRQMASGMARELMNEIWNAISIGLGAYLSAAAAIYLVVVGVRRYRAK